MAAQTMATAAPMTRMPSKPEEKYSALWCPNGCSASAGRAATVTITRANMAPARFTNDSSASDSRLTEPVTHHASVLRTMVSTATMMETCSQRRGVIRSRALDTGGV